MDRDQFGELREKKVLELESKALREFLKFSKKQSIRHWVNDKLFKEIETKDTTRENSFVITRRGLWIDLECPLYILKLLYDVFTEKGFSTTLEEKALKLTISW